MDVLQDIPLLIELSVSYVQTRAKDQLLMIKVNASYNCKAVLQDLQQQMDNAPIVMLIMVIKKHLIKICVWNL